jgi:uncharacterized membrane protein YpjA
MNPEHVQMKISKIEYVSQLGEVHTTNDNIDVLVHLSNGRVYSFIVATPNNIFWCMENEKIDYYFGVPPVFVATLTPENIERALQALVSENDGRWLSVYGTLQKQNTID